MTPTKLDDALTGCSAEPIHIPGAIQPFGVLFALQGSESTVSDLLVARHSQNAGELMDAGARLVGRRIGDLFDLDSLRPIEARDFQTTEPVVVATRAAGAEHLWQAFVHRHRGQLILELERVSATPTRAPGLLSASMREGLQTIEAARSVVELCQRACETIKALTGLDGVMAYKFHEDEHGEVIAESKAAAFPQYLGLHYPASDIPRQARALFLDNWVRMIPDRDYRPVPLVGGEQAPPLDLGRAFLRSVSPIHIEYLRNMGVRASLTLSIVCESKLWGLFAGHHYSAPKHVPFDTRAACETIARITSLLLLQKSAEEDSGAHERAARARSQLVSHMRESSEIAEGLLGGAITLQELVSCGGAAVMSADGQWQTVGNTPSPDRIGEISRWIEERHGAPEIFHTEHLATDYGTAADFSDVASGVLAVRIPKGQANYVMWFKQEVLQTVRWAGDPHKAIAPDTTSTRLHPRHSFEEWRQAVRQRSLPWTNADLASALELNHAIATIDLQRQFEREQEAKARAEWAGEQKEQLLAMVSHDLRDPLQSLKLNVSLLRTLTQEAEATLVLTSMERALERMNRLIGDLLAISKLESGTARLDVADYQTADLVRDVHQLLLPIAQDKGVRLEVEFDESSVRCDRDRILQVLSNLVSNAVKFTPQGGLVQMCAEATARERRFVVKDSGPGIPSENLAFVFDRFWQARQSQRLGTGLGLTIAKGIVEAHGGRIWAESQVGHGSTFIFVLPATI
jgi:Bacteriophytochrome (light-regulated signal transduction histidine kinase)